MYRKRRPKQPNKIPARCNRLRIDELRAHLAPIAVRYCPWIGSTQSAALEMLRDGRIVPPTLLITSRQTRGLGRRGPGWWSARGALTMTLALPPQPQLPPVEIGIRAAVAIADAIESPRVLLKWPNDLVAMIRGRGRKLGGILGQRIDRGEVIGVGINVNLPVHQAPATLRTGIASLHQLADHPIDLTDLAVAVTQRLFDQIAVRPPPFADVLRGYRSRDGLLGRRIKVRLDPDRSVWGTARGIDAQGRLIFKQGRQLREVQTGHIQRW